MGRCIQVCGTAMSAMSLFPLRKNTRLHVSWSSFRWYPRSSTLYWKRHRRHPPPPFEYPAFHRHLGYLWRCSRRRLRLSAYFKLSSFFTDRVVFSHSRCCHPPPIVFLCWCPFTSSTPCLINRLRTARRLAPSPLPLLLFLFVSQISQTIY